MTVAGVSTKRATVLEAVPAGERAARVPQCSSRPPQGALGILAVAVGFLSRWPRGEKAAAPGPVRGHMVERLFHHAPHPYPLALSSGLAGPLLTPSFT